MTPEQSREVESFLGEFLPRLKEEQPGVVAVYHFRKPDKEELTAIAGTDENARVAYRESDLIKEALALEQRLGLASTREAHPLTLALN